MNPNTRYNAQQVASVDWQFTTGNNGGLGWDDLKVAVLLDIAHSLRAIRNNLNALGSDGIHEAIRRQVKEQRRVERLRRAKARAARQKRQALKVA